MGLLKTIRKLKQSERGMRLLMLGLDNAGKTTVLYTYCEFKVNVWDVGGQKSLRSFWRNYFDTTDGLIWVVDSSDRHRLSDCKTELQTVLKEERLSGASLLILANKQDLPGSMSPDEVADVLGIDQIKRNRHCAVFNCSVFDKKSVVTGIDWIINDIGNPEQFNPIVFDCGSSSVRVGWSGHDQPKIVESRRDRVTEYDHKRREWVLEKDSLGSLTETLLYSQRGRQTNQFEHPVIATIPTNVPPGYKQAYYEHFMEAAQVPAVFLGDTTVLSLYAVGRVGGVCADLGASHTSVSQVEKGRVAHSNTYTICGDSISQFVLSRLESALPAEDQLLRMNLVRDIKHAACKCSHFALPPVSPSGARVARGNRKSAPVASPTSKGSAAEAVLLKLPDGSEIDVSSVSEYAAESLFVSSSECPGGVAGAVAEVSMRQEGEFVLLTGGTSHVHGLHSRLLNELEAKEAKASVFPFCQWTHRNHSGFVGASILASLSSFSSLWVTPASYHENGVDRIIGLK